MPRVEHLLEFATINKVGIGAVSCFLVARGANYEVF